MEIRSLLTSWLKPGSSSGEEAASGGGGDEVESAEAPSEAPRAAQRTGPRPDHGASPEPTVQAAEETVRAEREQMAAQMEFRARREEIVRMEERALRDLASAQTQLREAERRERILDDRERSLDDERERLRREKRRQMMELERIAGLTEAQARQILIKEVEDEANHQAALTIRRVEEETKLEAERRARGILAVAMQRLASTQSTESNTRTITLPSEEMKGRIIGKDGRNIRALEGLTGVDIIIDETPETVVLSSFDGVRREIARMTLEKLIADGRIHPSSCERAYEQSVAEMDDRMVEAAEKALLEARVTGVHPEIVRLLGRLKFRTSYSQNVLDHLVECSHLAALMAAELGASVEVARRAALLHDLGKAVSHEVEGTHAVVGARLARRYDEVEAIAHAIEAHHNEVDPMTVEAVIVQAADALSGARPGARGDSLEQYVTRLGDLEDIALRMDGVKKVYAMQAGREIRVMVDPGKVDDERASLISHEIATAIEREMQYPGQIKITVIRELRATNVAR